MRTFSATRDFAMTISEIARKLEISKEAVQSAQSRALRKLRKDPVSVGILRGLAAEVNAMRAQRYMAMDSDEEEVA